MLDLAYRWTPLSLLLPYCHSSETSFHSSDYSTELSRLLCAIFSNNGWTIATFFAHASARDLFFAAMIIEVPCQLLSGIKEKKYATNRLGFNRSSQSPMANVAPAASRFLMAPLRAAKFISRRAMSLHDQSDVARRHIVDQWKIVRGKSERSIRSELRFSNQSWCQADKCSAAAGKQVTAGTEKRFKSDCIESDARSTRGPGTSLSPAAAHRRIDSYASIANEGWRMTTRKTCIHNRRYVAMTLYTVINSSLTSNDSRCFDEKKTVSKRRAHVNKTTFLHRQYHHKN